MASLLTTNNLTVQHDKPVVNSVSFNLDSGGLLLVLGPSGAGKSTLLRCINRLQALDLGNIQLNGEDIANLDVCDLRRRIGMVFQKPALFNGTVAHNIGLGPSLNNQSLAKETIEQLATAVGLSKSMLDRQAESLSVGEQQRVAFAQALANHPEMLLLDEPTSALDPTSVLIIEKLILKIHLEMKQAIIMVTHNVQQALRLNAETLVMVEGKIIARGPIHALIEDQDNESLVKFFEGRLNSGGSADGI